MLAWILEYLGRADVHVMDGLFESWKAERREVLYKPVETGPTRLTPAVNPAIRATLESLRDDLRSPPRRHGRMPKLIDFRSREEFNGERSLGEDVPGHIPGAVNIAWRDLASAPERILKSKAELVRILGDAGVTRDDQVVAYCRSGPRAALGYLALREVGFDVRLFDGSYAEWSRAGLPVEK
jgi:thiosulfate/3-mercaptopyruvate sulfurtransferase